MDEGTGQSAGKRIDVASLAWCDPRAPPATARDVTSQAMAPRAKPASSVTSEQPACCADRHGVGADERRSAVKRVDALYGESFFPTFRDVRNHRSFECHQAWPLDPSVIGVNALPIQPAAPTDRLGRTHENLLRVAATKRARSAMPPETIAGTAAANVSRKKNFTRS